MDSDVAKEAGGKRLERLADVIHWIQFIVILSAGAITGLFLATGLFSDASDAKAIFAVGLAAWPAGALSAVVLAGIAYIFSGQFRVLPASYRSPQFVAFAAIPLLTFGVTKAFFPDKEVSAYEAFTEVVEEENVPRYSSEPLGPGKTEYTHKFTGNYLVVDTNTSGPDYIAATVVDGWFIGTAYWKVACEPASKVALAVTCNNAGDEAYSTLKLESPDWNEWSFEWEFDSSGYRVSEELHLWPLDRARQVDAVQTSKGVKRPNVVGLKTAKEAFWFGDDSP